MSNRLHKNEILVIYNGILHSIDVLPLSRNTMNLASQSALEILLLNVPKTGTAEQGGLVGLCPPPTFSKNNAFKSCA